MGRGGGIAPSICNKKKIRDWWVKRCWYCLKQLLDADIDRFNVFRRNTRAHAFLLDLILLGVV